MANSGTNPTGNNLGNFGFTSSVFIDFASDNNNYYAFVINHLPGQLIRLDFGNSLLNTPTAVNLGTIGGILPNSCEGIQLVKNEGKWYAIIVGGNPIGKIVKLEFGASLSNTPVGTDWGNIGNLAFPVDLHVFQDGINWYGFTINAQTSTITRFNFTNSFTNIPTGVNLGNIGGLNFPTGIYAVNNNNKWHVFVTNAASGGSDASNASLTRLDFGNSLLNTPTGVNLGNPGNTLRSTRDIVINKSCNEIVGYVVNYSSTNDIVRFDFNNDLTTIPTATSIGNIGTLNFPHCISRLYRVDNDLYSFIVNVNNNTLSRLKFSGCSSSSITNSSLRNPPPFTYNVPGVYNINLTIDDGLATQQSVCKKIVVVESFQSTLQSKSYCAGDSVMLTARNSSGNLWNTGSRADFIEVKTPGLYWVQSTRGTCVYTDSFMVSTKPLPVVNLGKDTALCMKDSLVLNAGNAGSDFLWQNGQTTQTFVVKQPGLYHVAVIKDGCLRRDSIEIAQLSLPVIGVTGNTTICQQGRTELSASGGSAYSWYPTLGLTNPNSASTTAGPDETTKYYVAVSNQAGCKAVDSITVFVSPKPFFSVSSSKNVLCRGDTATLIASGGDSYAWSPSLTLSSPSSGTTLAYPLSSMSYKVFIGDSKCQLRDSFVINLPVVDKPTVITTKSNDITCTLSSAALLTTGGSSYLWRPSNGLSDSMSNNPSVSIDETTTFRVFVTTADGCTVEDSITVNVFTDNDGSGFPVPNAFTPNGDGRNDCFSVKYWREVNEFSMNIFNRWGDLVFHADHPSQCWNGVYKGERQPPDVYVYWIKAKTRCGTLFRKGSFALIR